MKKALLKKLLLSLTIGASVAAVVVGGSYALRSMPMNNSPTSGIEESQDIPIMLHEHDYIELSREEPTCSKEGVAIYECSSCKDAYQEALDMIKHTEGEWVVIKEPTTTSTGLKEKYCTVCNELIDSEEIDFIKDLAVAPDPSPTVHSHTYEREIIKAATCSETGLEITKCTKCDYKCETILRATGHSLITDALAATCMSDGVTITSCKNCDYEEKETIPMFGHNYSKKVIAPTCTEEGYTEYTCANDSSHIYRENTIQATGHDKGELSVTTEATCEKSGLKEAKCESCKEVLKSEAIPALGHKYKVVENVAPTCNKNGYILEKCEVCNTEKKQVVEKTGHDHKVLEVVEPTCEENGYTFYICQNDSNHTKQGDLVPPTGHEETTWKITKAATCIETGIEEEFCNKCNKSINQKTIPATNHAYEVKENTPATCTAKGLTTYVCTKCEDTYDEELDILPHDYKVKAHTDATCTTDGTDVYECSICLNSYSEPIKAFNHKYSLAEEKDSTCTEEGYKKYICANCNDTYSDPISLKNHNYAETSKTDATCTENGSVTYTCRNCPNNYTDTIPASGHNYKVIGDNGHVKTHSCSGCGDTYPEIYGEEHHYKEVSKTLATCTSDGVINYICEDCGAEYSETLPKTGHKEITEMTKAPNCSSEGENTISCEKCRTILRTETIQKANHNLISEVTEQPTCAKEGTKVTKCSVCDEVINSDSIEKLTHTLVTEITTKPTCTIEGVNTIKCNVCDEVTKEETIPANGHSYEIESTVPAKCGEKGNKHFVCVVCSDSYDEEIAALNHSYIVTNTTNPSCSKEGNKHYECEYCSDSYDEPIKKTEHNYTAKVTEGTCITKEQTTYSCSECNNSYTEETGHYGYHLYELTETVTPTCEVDGKEVRTCKYCSDKQTTALNATGHDYQVAEHKDPECEKVGYDKYVCSKCNANYTNNITATGHTEGDWVIITEATQTTKGLKQKSCTKCNKVLDEETIPVLDSIDKAYTIDLGNGQTATVYGHFVNDYADEVFELLNDYREENGLKRLKHKTVLDNGAAIRAYEIVHTWSHTRPNGERCFSVAPYDSNSENIAMGYPTPEAVMDGWKDSEGHNENMLRSSFNYVSIQCFAAKIESNGYTYYSYYWVQLFGC